MSLIDSGFLNKIYSGEQPILYYKSRHNFGLGSQGRFFGIEELTRKLQFF